MDQIDDILNLVQRLFLVYDLDSNGYLDRQETNSLLNDVCTDMKLTKLENYQTEKIFNALDSNSDNEITYAEISKNYVVIERILLDKIKSRSLILTRKLFSHLKKCHTDLIKTPQMKELIL